jgi:hypothetical protein
MHQIDLMKDYSGHFQLSLLSNGSLLSESNYFDIFFTWVKIVRDYSGSIKYLVSEIFFFHFLHKTLSSEMISNKNHDPELLIITRGIFFLFKFIQNVYSTSIKV